MDTCFLFAKHLDENGTFCLKLNSEGELTEPPIKRSFDEIRQLQTECTTVIVESCDQAILVDLELPWLTDRKARLAIPFALEEKLAQPIEELHFAFDKLRYQNNHYLVAVISIQRMQYLMQVMTEHSIRFDTITLDWFALSPSELCVSEYNLLVNNDDFKGALSGNLALEYIIQHPLTQAHTFQDSQIINELTLSPKAEHSTVWIAKRLFLSKPLNLCQGNLAHENATQWIYKGYKLAGVLACVWVASLILANVLQLHSINKKTAVVDTEIATIYREFFPDAKQVINPKFRIKQVLDNNSSSGQNHFWFVLNQFSKAFKSNELTIEQLRYQNNTLSVTLVTADFAHLESLENALKQLQIKVKQTQASTRDQQVIATLELS